jgi:hypothetical protein|nr:MAG TPA: General transcription factor IIH subunit repair, TFIIH, TFIIH interaction.4A [Caudoviricetes sp.]
MAYSKTNYRLSDGTDLIELFKNPSLSGLTQSIQNVMRVGATTFTDRQGGVTVSASRDDFGRLTGVKVGYVCPDCKDYPCSDSGDSCCNECDSG